jgi:hypothetical protein
MTNLETAVAVASLGPPTLLFVRGGHLLHGRSDSQVESSNVFRDKVYRPARTVVA